MIAKKILIRSALVVIFILVVTYFILFIWGTEIISALYNVDTDNYIFEKNYYLYRNTDSDNENKSRIKILVYSDDSNKDLTRVLVFTYSKITSRLINYASINIVNGQIHIKERNIFFAGNVATDFSQLLSEPNFITVIFNQYVDTLYPPKKEDVYLSIGTLLKGESIEDSNTYLKDKEIDLLFTKSLSNSKLLVIHEGRDSKHN
ncbi:hypothetical protein [Proteiniclasticum ruminis]|uniref:Uncharacterized protein n=1 Tax=Proteiniclasticum ruminis TaxID=398199 RepID=A0A1I5F5R2_9CLOT|nr:hypothetical protein [Proteiniclasticum ruminis]SFO18959.1 hypothetical protein SAMN04488695_1311 [Proteiniclasticum ruminis]